VPPSKSISHRAIIAASLAKGISHVDNIVFSEDIEATCGAVESFGCTVNKSRGGLQVISDGKIRKPKHPIDCRESGSTLRFMVPFGGLVDEPVVFKGDESLRKRPMKPYYDIFKEQKIRYLTQGGLPLVVDGRLKPGKFTLKGDVSSQFITGLMFALPLMEGDSEIEMATPLESKGYVDLTMQVLDDFGIQIEHDDFKKFRIKGQQCYTQADVTVEGDYSQAAFWIVAGLIGGDITIQGLKQKTRQGDAEILYIVEQMGGKLRFENENLFVSKSQTKGITIDASQCPDLVPIVTVLAALSDGKTEIINASRLRIKESDRLKAISTELNKLGAQIVEQPDGLLIFGKERLKGGIVNSWNDHRIAMSLVVASIKSTDSVILENTEAINKSYPHFIEHFKKLGGIICE
jgi:3-phosphoshikimate 1-carboxyvinyltransferase